MGHVIYFTIGWMVMAFLYFQNHKFPFRLNFLLFMVLEIIQINLFTSFTMRWKLFTLSEHPAEFITIVIHRDIIFPLTLLIWSNYVFWQASIVKRIIFSVGVLLFLSATEQGLRMLEFIHDRHWNIGYFIGICLVLGIISILFIGIMLKLINKEKHINGDTFGKHP